MQIDILALAAHRDDVEQTCGGTLLKMAELGHRTGILDLTQGEMGTRGSRELRDRESAEAARILRVKWRSALDIPDGRVENTWENKLKIVRVLREQRPRVLILPYWLGRHPDHYTASTLGYEASFLAGLAKLGKVRDASQRKDPPFAKSGRKGGAPAAERVKVRERGPAGETLAVHLHKAGLSGAPGINDRHLPKENRCPPQQAPKPTLAGDPGCGRPSVFGSKENELLESVARLDPHRPFKIIYASLYHDVRPTFVVDITEQFERRFESLMAYKSQYEDQAEGADIFPAKQEIRARIESMARFYGMLAGVTYAEPFVQKEIGLVDDLLTIPVRSL
jgi:LmbE family N-acetylglucosaminyl deacetylase